MFIPFCFGEDILEFTSIYKYLGLFVDEHITFLHGPSALADSASRALGGVVGKTKPLKDIGYAAYSKLY